MVASAMEKKPLHTLGCKDKSVCPKCRANVHHFYVRESISDFAIVDLTCWKCGHSWSECWSSDKIEQLPSKLQNKPYPCGY